MENKEIHVVKVISKTRLVLNVGSKEGILDNSKFLIFSVDEQEITDPITGENLGKLELVKGTGHVIHLQEKICTIETFAKEKSHRIIRRTNPLWGSVLGYNIGAETETEEIPSKELEKFEDVNVGDYAKLI